MKKEIDVALDILLAYVQRFGTIKDQTMEQFRSQLEQILFERYQGHWYPDKPIKGQAYRSLEFNKDNDYCDAIVSQICQQLGFASNLLGIRHDLTLWIDPYEITIRLGNHASPKENQQLIVARFDHQGNELIRNDLDTLLSQSRLPLTTNNARSSPTNCSSCDSASCSGSSTPQRTSSPFPFGQTSTSSTSSLTSMIPTSTTLFHNGPLYTSPRALSPQAPAFQMSPSAPIKVPLHQQHQLAVYQTTEPNSSEGSPSDGNHFQPDRSDTPYSMNSTTSNESSDSGYCGYVESFPYYYKLNRLYKALAIQKLSTNNVPTSRGGHSQRRPQATGYAHGYQQQQQQQNPHHYHQNSHPHAAPTYHGHPNGNIPSTNLSSSPPTPTPMNINQFSPFYAGQSPFLPMSTTISDSRKSKY